MCALSVHVCVIPMNGSCLLATHIHLFACCSHDKTAAQKFFLGSTSTYCSTHSEMPVVIVRTG